MVNEPHHIPRGSAQVIIVRNAEEALQIGLKFLEEEGLRSESRNGVVLRAPGPVITHYTLPQWRVMFSPLRDANPFFHLMESLWMLAGCNDLPVVERYAANMRNFSDDGISLWGGYGARWRHWFGKDQLDRIIGELQADPTSRRCVLSMWDERQDPAKAAAGGKDVPCNTQAFFEVQDNLLNMTVCNRSNDIVWGAYGANFVHFGFLQEYMANRIGAGVGAYYQMSNNYHAYVERADVMRLWPVGKEPGYTATGLDKYCLTQVYPYALHAFDTTFDEEVYDFVQDLRERRVPRVPKNPFLRDVAMPMAQAHAMHKEGRTREAAHYLRNQTAGAVDWLVAGAEWLERRLDRQQAVAKG